MVFRLQLEVEIDTTARTTKVVNPILSEGPDHVCLHCSKPIPLKVKYCNQSCFRQHGHRGRTRKIQVAYDRAAESVQVVPPAFSPAVPVPVTLPRREYSTFSFSEGVTV